MGYGIRRVLIRVIYCHLGTPIELLRQVHQSEYVMTEKPTPEQTARMTFDLPVDLHKRLKIQAVHEGRSVREILEELIRDYLKRVV